MPSNHLILCCSLLFLLSIFLSIRVFSNESALLSGDQSIGTSASVLPINIQGWLPLGLTGLISSLSKGLSRVFSSTTVLLVHISDVTFSERLPWSPCIRRLLTKIPLVIPLYLITILIILRDFITTSTHLYMYLFSCFIITILLWEKEPLNHVSTASRPVSIWKRVDGD